MNIDVLFTSKSGTLYAGIERGGKFAGKPGWAKPGAKGKADRGGYAPKGRKA